MKESVRKKTNIALAALAAAMLITALLLGFGTAFGWFFDEKTEEKEQPFVPFAVSVRVGFEQDDGALTPVADPQYFSAELFRSADGTAPANYVGRLRVWATYSGTESACLRVHVLHFWSNGSDTVSRANAPFTAAAGFTESAGEMCYYYGTTDPGTGDKRAYVLGPAQSAVEMPVIVAPFDETLPFEAGLKLNLVIQAELVQSNRTLERWGVGTAAHPAE